MGGIDQYLGAIVTGHFGGRRDTLTLGACSGLAFNKLIGLSVYNL